MKVRAPKDEICMRDKFGLWDLLRHDVLRHDVGEIVFAFKLVGGNNDCSNGFANHMERDSNMFLRQVSSWVL